MFDVKGFLNDITTRLLFTGVDYWYHPNANNGGHYRITHNAKPDPDAISGTRGYADEGAISLTYRRLSVSAALGASDIFWLKPFHF